MIIKPSDIEIDEQRINELISQYEKDIERDFDLLPCDDKGEIITHTYKGTRLNIRFSEYRDKYLLFHCLKKYLETSRPLN